MIHNTLNYLTVLLLLFAASGAACANKRFDLREESPVLFTQPPTLAQLIEAINANSRPVRQLQAERAKLSYQNLPGIGANLAVEAPRRLRLRAEFLGLGNPDLDLGSNDEQYWIWSKWNKPAGIYYVRRDELAAGRTPQLPPFDPVWLIDALGLIQLNPANQYEGPYALGGGRVEIRWRETVGAHAVTRVLVAHEKYGWVLEQRVYDSSGQLIAAVLASDHRPYPAHGVTLPHRLEIQLAPGQPSQMTLRLNVRGYLINQLYGDAAHLWAMPRYEGQPLINLADPALYSAQRHMPARRRDALQPALQQPGSQRLLQMAPGVYDRYPGRARSNVASGNVAPWNGHR